MIIIIIPRQENTSSNINKEFGMLLNKINKTPNIEKAYKILLQRISLLSCIDLSTCKIFVIRRNGHKQMIQTDTRGEINKG